MMGEAWSDYYALDLLQSQGWVTDAPARGRHPGNHVSGPNGIRSKPIDCPVAPAGFANCDRNGTATTVLGGYTYGDITRTNNVGGPHNGGEVWAETLWDLRRAVGREAALALITGGMRLTVDNPSMIDARDAILQQALAMRSAPGRAERLLRRGLGGVPRPRHGLRRDDQRASGHGSRRELQRAVERALRRASRWCATRTRAATTTATSSPVSASRSPRPCTPRA